MTINGGSVLRAGGRLFPCFCRDHRLCLPIQTVRRHAVTATAAELAHRFAHLAQSGVRAPMNAVFREFIVLASLARHKAGEHLERLVDAVNGQYLEVAPAGRLRHIFPQHQVPAVARGNDYSLATGKSDCPAEIVETFDLLVYPTDGLHVTLLIDRAGDSQVLTNWRIRQAGDDRAELRQGSGVPVDGIIPLLE